MDSVDIGRKMQLDDMYNELDEVLDMSGDQ